MVSISRLVACAVFCCSVFGSDWPQWRGPDRDGISKEKGWSSTWPDEGPKIAWKGKVGLGFSSFVVGQGRAYTAGHQNGKDSLFCFDAKTGKQLWTHAYDAELGDKFFQGGTTGTATIDGNNLYWLSRWGDLFCFDAASGKILWQRNLQKDSEIHVPTWGFSGAPTAHEKFLFLNVREHGMALDKLTGKTIWESPDKDPGYSTPLPWKKEGKWTLLVSSGEAYFGVDLETGKELWKMKWLTEYGVNAADPVPSGDKIFISTGYGKGAALIKPNSSEAPEVLWTKKVLRTQQAPAVLLDGFVYGVDGDAGSPAPLKCIELETGKERWSYPLNFGAVSAADGKLIVISAAGELMVAPATPEGFKPTARAQVLGSSCWTVPVLANGLIYCRNSKGDVAAVDVSGGSK